MNFKKYIEMDKNRWKGKRHLFFIPQYRFVYLKQKCEFWRTQNKLYFCFWYLIYRKYKIKYLLDIPASVKIGPGFKIEHIGNIVINPSAKLGKNISILSGVLIGAEARGKRKGTPTIGNNVYLSANVVIVGNVNIGNNVLIAANTFVNFDVPDNSIVVGNKIIPSKQATRDYI